jgi:hypothetical protein
VAQLNINMTPEFERALERLMRLRGITTKSEAVRVAVLEAADRHRARGRPEAIRALRGAGLRAPLAAKPTFSSEDDLWK